MRDEKADDTLPSAIPTVETARLLLRPFTAFDLDDYTRLIFADAEVMRYLPKRDLAPRARAERSIAFFNDHWSRCGYGVWAVTDKATGSFIGQCGLNDVQEAQAVEVLCALGKPYWNQGLATEAAQASARFGFDHAHLTRLIALAVPENGRSRRVLEHLGFIYEKDAHYFELDLTCYVLPREQNQLAGSFFLVH